MYLIMFFSPNCPGMLQWGQLQRLQGQRPRFYESSSFVHWLLTSEIITCEMSLSFPICKKAITLEKNFAVDGHSTRCSVNATINYHHHQHFNIIGTSLTEERISFKTQYKNNKKGQKKFTFCKAEKTSNIFKTVSLCGHLKERFPVELAICQ